MAIAFKQQNNVGAGSGSNLAAPFTFAIAAGDLLLVAVTFNNGQTVSQVADTLGNVYTLIKSQNLVNGATLSTYFCYSNAAALANANTLTVTFTGAITFARLNISAYSGLTGNPNTSNGNAASSGTIDAGGINTANPNELILLWAVIDTTGTAFTPSAGFTKRLDDTTQALADSFVNSAGAQNPTFGITVSQPWAGIAAAFKQFIPNSVKPFGVSSVIQLGTLRDIPLELDE